MAAATVVAFKKFLTHGKSIVTYWPNTNVRVVRVVESVGPSGVWFKAADGKRSYLNWPKRSELSRTDDNDVWSVYDSDDPTFRIDYWEEPIYCLCCNQEIAKD